MERSKHRSSSFLSHSSKESFEGLLQDPLDEFPDHQEERLSQPFFFMIQHQLVGPSILRYLFDSCCRSLKITPRLIWGLESNGWQPNKDLHKVFLEKLW